MSAPPVLPTTDEEIWRYSRIGELDLSAFVPGACRTETVGAEPWRGRVDLVGSVMTEPADVFAEMNLASARSHPDDVIVLSVPRGRVVEGPVEIIHHVETAGIVAHPRVVIEAAENSQITVVERFVSAAGTVSLLCPVLEIRAHQAARVDYVAVNQLGTGTWQVAHQHAEGDRDSTLRLSTIALGGDYARVRSSVRLVGQGADAQQTALYFAGGDQMHDFRTTQIHAAPRTRSDLLFKGAVRDRARSVYTGLIRIEREATGSEAYQTNRNLTLSEGAWAESVPNLEIETNEVKCSHASTVGPVDEDQRFYLESRGIEPSVAERLVVLGFFNEVLGRMPASLHLDDVAADIAAKLLAEVAP
jgi:Fe-S cluster assembly protein SufD